MAKKPHVERDAKIVIVRERGVNAKGFGHVAKRIMSDNSVSISAKGIYGYLSSMAGSGESSFMRRSRLLAELNIGERAYDTNMRQLEERGYIARAQSRTLTGYYGTTIIEFVMIPSHLKQEILEAQNSETKPTMYSGTVYALGYGSVPRLVMQDLDLSVKAKGLYAYFCAYAGPDSESFPSRLQILTELNIGKNSYNDYRRELEEKKYITTYRKHCDGKLAGNYFKLNQFPDEVDDPKRVLVEVSSKDSSPIHHVPQNSSTDVQVPENSGTVLHVPKNECTVNERTDNERTVNECTAKSSTHINNNSNLTNNSSCITNTLGTKNSIILDRLIAMVREKIHYQILMFSYANEIDGCNAVDLLVSAVADVLSTAESRIMIGQQSLSSQYVQGVLLEISNEAVVNVIERYLAHKKSVIDPRAYLLTSIYNEISCPTQLEDDVL